MLYISLTLQTPAARCLQNISSHQCRLLCGLFAGVHVESMDFHVAGISGGVDLALYRMSLFFANITKNSCISCFRETPLFDFAFASTTY